MSVVRGYPGTLVRWVDGDTCRVDIDQGFYDWKMNRELRLVGWDTAELQGRAHRVVTLREKKVARYTLERVKEKFPEGSKITILSYPQEKGKYGRIIGDLILGRHHWSAYLEDEGLAVPYGKYDPGELDAKWAKIYEKLESDDEGWEIL